MESGFRQKGNSVSRSAGPGACHCALILLVAGACLALGASTGQNPDAPATEVAGSGVLGLGDVVQLTVWNEPELSVRAEVAEDGTVIFPFIGPVRAAGLTAAELEEIVQKKYADTYLVDPQVYITIARRRTSRVYVLGAVVSPGVYDVQQKTTLLELLARCGGASESASERIMIIRQAPVETKKERAAKGTGEAERAKATPGATKTGPLSVNLQRLLMGEMRENVVLEDRDVVLFPVSRQAREQIYILGDVATGGAYPLPEDVTLTRLLASIGLGPSDDKCKITVLRYSGDEVVTRSFSVRDVFLGKEGKDFNLQAGDVLNVERESAVYYVVGEVNGSGCFRFREGLTVREAIILAGWITRRGNLRKINVMRKVGEEWITEPVGLADKVQPGDVVKVEERWF